MKNYKDILLEGVKIAWNKKYLWFYGLFAVVFSGAGYESLIGSDIGEKTNFFYKLSSMGVFSMVNWGKQFIADPLITSLLFAFWLFVLLMFVFVIWLSNVSRISIIKNIYLARESKDSFEIGLKHGIHYFWPVFFINLLFIIFISIVSTVVYSPLMVIENEFVSALLYSVVFVLLLLFIIVFSFISKYAIAFVVIKGNKFGEAIVNAYRLFTKNWLVSFEMSVLLFFINVGALVVLFVLLATFGLPSLWIINFISFTFVNLSFWMMMILIVLLVAMVGVFGAIVSTFQISTWTTLYIELITTGKKSKLLSFFSKK